MDNFKDLYQLIRENRIGTEEAAERLARVDIELEKEDVEKAAARESVNSQKAVKAVSSAGTRTAFGMLGEPAGAAPPPVSEPEMIASFKQLLSSVTKLPKDKIRSDVLFEKYGIDSVMVMKMTRELEKTYGTLSKTLFFEHLTVRQIARHFLSQYPGILPEMGPEPPLPVPAEPPRARSFAGIPENQEKTNKKEEEKPRDSSTTGKTPKSPARPGTGGIAVIGVAGRYPEAETLYQFWHNLAAEGTASPRSRLPVGPRPLLRSGPGKAREVLHKMGGISGRRGPVRSPVFRDLSQRGPDHGSPGTPFPGMRL